MHNVVFRNILSFFLTLGLAILGWVSADVPFLLKSPGKAIWSFFEHPWGLVFVISILLESIIFAFFVPLHMNPKDEKDERWGYWRGTILETVIVLAIFCDHTQVAVMHTGDWIRYVGIGLILFSLGIALWSGYLRKVQIQKDGEDVFLTQGPNRWIRYPEQLSIIITYLGISFLFVSWAGIFLEVMLIISLVRYAAVQDELMAKKYKVDWLKYQRGTKRLFPFIY